MSKPQTYVGINNEINGGMTAIGKTIRDAWVFGLLNESETCVGWNAAMVDVLLDKVNREWDRYGCLVSNLPAELFERHQRIHDNAFIKAQAAGWSGAFEVEDEV